MPVFKHSLCPISSSYNAGRGAPGVGVWRACNQFSSVAQLFLTLYDSMDCSTPGFPVRYQLPELTQTHVHQIGDAIQPSHPLSSLFLLPSIFPSIRVFSSASAVHIRSPKYWSFSFSISPSNEYSGLISFESENESTQLCPTLCDPMDSSPPGPSVHRILQARILEWVAISYSRGSS